ncbi:beta strand repeat-containing protein, partial [Nanoarchaeota archaeon]
MKKSVMQPVLTALMLVYILLLAPVSYSVNESINATVNETGSVPDFTNETGTPEPEVNETPEDDPAPEEPVPPRAGASGKVTIAAAEATVTKTLLSGTPEVGETVQFMINVTNTGDASFDGDTIVFDEFNTAHMNLSGFSIALGDDDRENGEIGWDLSNSGPGSQFIVFVNFTAHTAGSTSNNITVENSTFHEMGSDTVNFEITSPGGGDGSVMVNKTSTEPDFIHDFFFEFVINVTNNGSIGLFEILAYDNYNASVMAFNDSSCAPIYTDVNGDEGLLDFNVTQCNGGILTPGSSYPIYVNFSDAGADLPAITINNVEVNATDTNTDVHVDYDDATITIRRPNITVTKTLLNQGTIYVDDIVEFKINVTNFDDPEISFTNLSVYDLFDSSMLEFNWSDTPPLSASAGDVKWNFTLADYVIIYANFTALQIGTTFNNVTLVEIEAEFGATNHSTDNESVTISAPSSVNATLVKTLLSANTTVGATLQYRINLTNTGGTAFPGTFYLDDLFNTTFLNFTWSNTTIFSDDRGNGSVNWDVSNLTSSASFVVLVNFTAVSAGDTSNYAALVNSTGAVLEEHDLGLTITAPTPSTLNLTFTKTAVSSSVVDGDDASFVLNVTNIGGVDAIDFFVGDFYNTSFLNYSWSNVSYDEFNDTEGEIWWEFSLTTGSTLSILVNFSTLTVGNTTNEAIVENSTMATLYSDDADLEITAAAAPAGGPPVGEFYFEFNGTVYNSDGTETLSGANISVHMHNDSVYPPNPLWTYNTTTNGTGWFNMTLPGAYAWTPRYSTTVFLENGTHIYVAKPLPDLYVDEFMSLSPINFYLKEAAKLNITVKNETGGIVPFNYQVKDVALGVIIIDEFDETVNQSSVYVQADRNYSVMVYPELTMPRSMPVSSLAAHGVVDVEFNTSESFVWVSGYAKRQNGTAAFDSLYVIPILLEAGDTVLMEVSPMPQDMSYWRGGADEDQFNGTSGLFDMTLQGVPSPGIDMVLMVVAEDWSGDGEEYIAYRNLSLLYGQGDVEDFNFTMIPQVGEANVNVSQQNNTGGYSTTSTFQVNFSIINASGSPVTTNAFVEAEVDYTSIGGPEFSFLEEVGEEGTGVFTLPLVAGQDVTLKVFAAQYAPKKFKIDSSDFGSTVLLNMTTFNPGAIDDGDFTGSDVFIDMIKSNPACNVPDYNEAACSLLPSGQENFSYFNPLKVLMGGGDISFVMGKISNGVTVMYKNADLLASGPPDVMFDGSADASSAGGTIDEAWRFGSTGPEIYDSVLIGVPYNTTLNTSTMNVTIVNLYDDDLNLIWNVSVNGTNPGATLTDYADYNQSWFTGMPCSIADISADCYINETSGFVWLSIPHFSVNEPVISGQVDAAAEGVINLTVTKTAVQSSVENGSIVSFTLNVTNVGVVNVTDYALWDEYNGTHLDFDNDTSIAYDDYNETTDELTWYFDLNVSESFVVVVNFTATLMGNTTNLASLENDTGDEIGTDNVEVEITAPQVQTGRIVNLSTGANLTINGIAAEDEAGFAVSSGDINGDGKDDIIVGAYKATANGLAYAGETYVVFGGVTGTINLSTDANLTIRGAILNESSGFTVASGDVNDDDIDDVIIGSHPNNHLGGGYGASGHNATTYVVFGGVTGIVNLSTDADITIHGYSTADASRHLVASGDINDDGKADIIIGDDFANPYGKYYAGRVHVVFGGVTGDLNISTDSNLTMNGITSNDSAGMVSSGDVNGDGNDDVIIGALQMSPFGASTGAGEAYVVFGGVTGTINLSSGADLTIKGINVNYSTGVATASGDVNGDGKDDVIVSANDATANGVAYAGQTYVVFGGVTGTVNLSTDANLTINGIDQSDGAGSALATGDFNGDGNDDIIIGAPSADSNTGETYIVYGGVTGTVNLSTNADWLFYGIDAGDTSGSVVFSGDFDGDNVYDVIIGAPYADSNGNSNSGETYVFLSNFTYNGSTESVVNISLSKTAVQSSVQNSSTAQFILNVTNVGTANVTGYMLLDDYNISMLNYSGATPAADTINYSGGELDWDLDLNVGQSFVVVVNFTTLQPGNTTNSGNVVNSTDDTIASDTAEVEIILSDTTYPVVILQTPDNLRTNTLQQTIACSVNETNLANVTLYHNVSGWAANETNSSGTVGIYSFVANYSEGDYLWNCQACDFSDNCAFGSANRTFTTDLTNPASVTGLANTSATLTSVFWDWTNPVDLDFNITLLYLNGTNVENSTGTSYNATGLTCGTVYQMVIHTRDDASNLNTTDVSDLGSTVACSAPPVINVSVDKVANVTNASETGVVDFTINIANTGDVPISNVTVLDWFNMSEWQWNASEPNTSTYWQIGGISYNEWNLTLDLGSGDSYLLNLTLSVYGFGGTNITNNVNVTVRYANGSEEIRQSDATVEIYSAAQIPNVTVSKSVVNSSVVNGSTVQFVLNVTNVGGVSASDYSVTDLYNSTYLDFDNDTSIGYDEYNETTDEITWYVDLNVSQSLVIYVNFTATTVGNTTNIASLENDTDDEIGTDSAEVEITAPAAPEEDNRTPMSFLGSVYDPAGAPLEDVNITLDRFEVECTNASFESNPDEHPGECNTTTVTESTMSIADGSFNLTFSPQFNTSLFEIKLIKYNASNPLIADYVNEPVFGIMGQTIIDITDFEFYLKEAATINLTINKTVPDGDNNFTYMLFDGESGKRVEVRWAGEGAESYMVYIPKERDYSLLMQGNGAYIQLNKEWQSAGFSDGINQFQYPLANVYTNITITVNKTNLNGLVCSGAILMPGNDTGEPGMFNWNTPEDGGSRYDSGINDSSNLTTGVYGLTIPHSGDDVNLLLICDAVDGSDRFIGFEDLTIGPGQSAYPVNMDLYAAAGSSTDCKRATDADRCFNVTSVDIGVEYPNGSMVPEDEYFMTAKLDLSGLIGADYTWWVGADEYVNNTVKLPLLLGEKVTFNVYPKTSEYAPLEKSVDVTGDMNVRISAWTAETINESQPSDPFIDIIISNES